MVKVSTSTLLATAFTALVATNAADMTESTATPKLSHSIKRGIVPIDGEQLLDGERFFQRSNVMPEQDSPTDNTQEVKYEEEEQAARALKEAAAQINWFRLFFGPGWLTDDAQEEEKRTMRALRESVGHRPEAIDWAKFYDINQRGSDGQQTSKQATSSNLRGVDLPKFDMARALKEDAAQVPEFMRWFFDPKRRLQEDDTKEQSVRVLKEDVAQQAEYWFGWDWLHDLRADDTQAAAEDAVQRGRLLKQAVAQHA